MNNFVTIHHGDEDSDNKGATSMLIINDIVVFQDDDPNGIALEIARAFDPEINEYEINASDLPEKWEAQDVILLIHQKDSLDKGYSFASFISPEDDTDKADLIATSDGAMIVINEQGFKLYETVEEGIQAALSSQAFEKSSDPFYVATIINDNGVLGIELLNGDTAQYENNNLTVNINRSAPGTSRLH